MANPKINTLTDLFQVDGFGFFGFGDGGFGGSYELLNPQWNTNSGSYGFDPIQGMAYIEATATPSYVGASLYDLTQSSFFAKITPAPNGNGSVQTGLLIRYDRHNYVEISYGPNGQFNAYSSIDSSITTTAMPAYDATAHAYWRIRNDGDTSNIFFDTSPDGSTWTQQGFVPFQWDITQVTVSIFAGFTGEETPGNLAYVSHVNQPATTLQLKGSVNAVSGVTGLLAITDPNALSGSVSASAGFRGKFTATLGIPEGGLSDFAYTYNLQTIDPLITNQWAPTNILNVVGSLPLATSSWFNGSTPITVPMPYRDGTYFQPAAYVNMRNYVSFTPDTISDMYTNAQLETTTGLDNRLPIDAVLYQNGCEYSGAACSVIRSTAHALNGQYAGQITSTTSPLTIGDGNKAYWLLPQRKALVPVRFDQFGQSESLFGSVYFSTTRANTIWFAALVYYDSSWNIIGSTTAGTTWLQSTITNKNTHPGGGVWQQGVIYDNNVPLNAVYAGVVPVVQSLNSSGPAETTYVSNHSITTASIGFTESSSAYEHPRTAKINVKADRVNYVLNSGFNAGNTYWFNGISGVSGSPNPGNMVWDNSVGYQSAGSLRYDVVPISGTFTGTSGGKIGLATAANFNGSSRQPVVQGLKVGHTYTISAWVKQGPNCPDIYMDFRDSNSLGVTGASTNSTKITNPERIDGNWTRIQTTYTVPPTGLSEYYFFFYVKFPDLSHAPFSYWIDSIMVEESDTYQGYFDGGYASADYKWESGGAANLSRSYYYKDYNNKFLRLNQALPSVLPVGEYYQLLFAQPV